MICHLKYGRGPNLLDPQDQTYAKMILAVIISDNNRLFVKYPLGNFKRNRSFYTLETGNITGHFLVLILKPTHCRRECIIDILYGGYNKVMILFIWLHDRGSII